MKDKRLLQQTQWPGYRVDYLDSEEEAGPEKTKNEKVTKREHIAEDDNAHLDSSISFIIKKNGITNKSHTSKLYIINQSIQNSSTLRIISSVLAFGQMGRIYPVLRSGRFMYLLCKRIILLQSKTPSSSVSIA